MKYLKVETNKFVFAKKKFSGGGLRLCLLKSGKKWRSKCSFTECTRNKLHNWLVSLYCLVLCLAFSIELYADGLFKDWWPSALKWSKKMCVWSKTCIVKAKLVNYSRRSNSLKYIWKLTNGCYRREMSSISEFFRMSKGSLCREI